MSTIRDIIESRGWHQNDIIDALSINQPRASNLLRGKINKFSSDALIGYLAKLGYTCKFKIRRS
jgi:predicted XRE-type DNA-binding protein